MNLKKMKQWIYLVFLSTCMLAGLAFVVSDCTSKVFAQEFIQPKYNPIRNEVLYIGTPYKYVRHFEGFAGYKTIDKKVDLRSTEFLHPIGKIYMIQTLPDLNIVGYGINHMYTEDGVVKWAKFSLEDSNCDGVMDEVALYNDLVFPPDCWDRKEI